MYIQPFTTSGMAVTLSGREGPFRQFLPLLLLYGTNLKTFSSGTAEGEGLVGL